jgi:hypothetical protein
MIADTNTPMNFVNAAPMTRPIAISTTAGLNVNDVKSRHMVIVGDACMLV